jgi:hypothetical protein
MTMIEIPIAPSEHPVIRRWFEGDNLDLIVWENLDGDIVRFRLLSRPIAGEVEGFAWSSADTLRHGHLPEAHGEHDWGSLQWVSESRPPSNKFIEAWTSEGSTLPSLIFTFIQNLFNNHNIHPIHPKVFERDGSLL